MCKKMIRYVEYNNTISMTLHMQPEYKGLNKTDQSKGLHYLPNNQDIIQRAQISFINNFDLFILRFYKGIINLDLIQKHKYRLLTGISDSIHEIRKNETQFIRT